MGEFELWMSSSQIIDLVYGLSDGNGGECSEDIRERLRGIRTFVNVFPVSDREIDLMLAAAWKDPEDYLLVEVALALKADAIVTRNQKDFPKGLVKVLDCDEFFAWMKEERGLVYDEVSL